MSLMICPRFCGQAFMHFKYAKDQFSSARYSQNPYNMGSGMESLTNAMEADSYEVRERFDRLDERLGMVEALLTKLTRSPLSNP